MSRHISTISTKNHLGAAVSNNARAGHRTRKFSRGSIVSFPRGVPLVGSPLGSPLININAQHFDEKTMSLNDTERQPLLSEHRLQQNEKNSTAAIEQERKTPWYMVVLGIFLVVFAGYLEK